MNENDFRDVAALFAMHAMIGQCEGNNFDDFVVAEQAYQMADFMVKERNKDPEEKGIVAIKKRARKAKE